MRAICLGESLIDFIATEAVPLPQASRYVRCLGGAAVNVAIGLHSKGIPVSLVSRVGKDMLGRQVLLELERKGVATPHVQIDPKRPTKCSFISHDEKGNRYIEMANRQSADQRIDLVESQKAFQDHFDLLYISGVMLIQEHGLKLVMQSVLAAKQKGALVAFDPVFDVARAGKSVRDRVVGFLHHVDILKVNDAEHQALFAQLLDPASQKAVILHTKGSDGAVIRYRQYEINIDAVQASCVDPTGAGDAFLSGFLAVLLKEQGHLEGVTRVQLSRWGEEGARNASRIIQKNGGNSGYLQDV